MTQFYRFRANAISGFADKLVSVRKLSITLSLSVFRETASIRRFICFEQSIKRNARLLLCIDFFEQTQLVTLVLTFKLFCDCAVTDASENGLK